MNKNEKLARNAVIARRAKKKQANKQNAVTKDKRTVTRFFALIGCLLLVATLAVPCFADGTDYPVVSVDPDITVDGERVNLNGYYELKFDYSNIDLDFFYDGEPVTMFQMGQDVYYKVNNQTTGSVVSGLGASQAFRFVKQSSRFGFGVGTTEFLYSSTDDVTVSFYLSVDPETVMQLGAYSPWGTYVPYSISVLEYPSIPDIPDTPDTPDTPDVDSGEISGVWSNVTNWIVRAISSVQSIFYAEGSLTFLGTLSVVGVGIALGFLLISVISRFLQLRG